MKTKKIPGDILFLFLTFLLIPFVMIPKWVYEYSTQKHLVFAFMFTGLMIFYLFKNNYLKNLSLKLPHIIFGVFGISTVLSLISVFIENPHYFRFSFEVSLYTLILVFFSIVVTNRFGKDFSFIENGLLVFLITGTIIAFDGLLNKFFGFDLFFGNIGDPSARITLRTTIGNPNFVSDYLAQLIPVSIYFILRPKGSLYLKIYSLITLFMSIWVVLFAQTRSIYLGTVVGMIVALISFFIAKKNKEDIKYFKSKQFITWLILIIFSFLFLFMMFNFDTPFNKGGEVVATDRFAAMNSISSWDERSLSWNAAIKQFIDPNHPNHKFIGSGIGTYPLYAIEYMSELQQEEPQRYLYAWNNFKRAHNDYLQVLGETGIIGFITILFLLLYLIFYFFKTLRNSLSLEKLLLFVLLGWSVTVVVAHAGTEFALHMHPNLLLALFILSIAVSDQFNNKTKNYKIKFNLKLLLIPLIIVGIITTFFKIQSTMSEAYFKKAQYQYNKLNEIDNALKDQFPSILNNLNQQYEQYQSQLNNYPPNSDQFRQITQTLDEIEERVKEIQNAQYNYSAEARDAYEKSMDFFLKSLDSNHTFGKSMFYLAQLFVETPYRYDDISYEDLPEAFDLKQKEYRHIIENYKGSIDLMPFEEPYLREDLSSIYSENIKNENARAKIVLLQGILDEITYLKTSFVYFTEKNSYKLISKLYYNMVIQLESLKEVIPDKSNEIRNLMAKYYDSFNHWNNKTIEILPGGWNRFPEWENTYAEIISMNINLLKYIDNEKVMNNIFHFIKKDGWANYHMANLNRGIPDTSLAILQDLYFNLDNKEIKKELVNEVVNSYKDVYNYYLNIDKTSGVFERYEDRIISFLDSYRYFERR